MWNCWKSRGAHILTFAGNQPAVFQDVARFTKKKPKVEKISALFFVAAATIHQMEMMVYKIKSEKNVHLSSHETSSEVRFIPDCESVKLESS
jgi:hypothetical protein